MSVWSVRRQLIFFFLAVLFVAVLVAILLWRFWPESSCTDGRQNQNETGVDCGGVCSAVCLNEVQPARVLWARILPLPGGAYDVAALVENPNPDLVLVSLPYNLRLFDDDNLFITRLAGRVALGPREQFIVFETNVNVGRRRPARARLDFSGQAIWQRGEDRLALVVTDRRFTASPPLLEARLTNNSRRSYRGIRVAAVLSDDRRNAIAASLTAVEELAPGAAKEISFSWPGPLAAEPAFIDFYPHVAIGNKDN